MIPDQKTATHPFAIWAGQLATLGACKLDGGKNNDIKLSELGAKRVALGLHDNEPLICFLPEDQEAIQSIRWSSAALLLNFKFQDWIALSARDIRPAGQNGIAYPARLFIPIGYGLLRAFRPLAPSTILHLGIMAFSKENGRPIFEGRPFASLPAIIK